MPPSHARKLSACQAASRQTDSLNQIPKSLVAVQIVVVRIEIQIHRVWRMFGGRFSQPCERLILLIQQSVIYRQGRRGWILRARTSMMSRIVTMMPKSGMTMTTAARTSGDIGEPPSMLRPANIFRVRSPGTFAAICTDFVVWDRSD